MLGAKFGKKHTLALVLVLVAITAIFVVRAINGNTVDTSKPWHPLQQIAKDETSFESVDANANGIIDEAENASYAERAGTCDSCGAGVKSGDVVAGYLLLYASYTDSRGLREGVTGADFVSPTMYLGSSKDAWMEMIKLEYSAYERLQHPWLLQWAPIALRGDEFDKDFVNVPCYFPEAGKYKIVIRVKNANENGYKFWIDGKEENWGYPTYYVQSFGDGSKLYELSWDINTPGVKTCRFRTNLDSDPDLFYGFFIYKA